jgi:transcriptional regulator with XRE-family HTH domain
MTGEGEKVDRLKTRHIDILLGKRLREIRDAMGLSREEVGAGLDVSDSRIRDFEEGERISASRLWQFCNLYGVAVDSLFEGLPYHVGRRANTPEEVRPNAADEGADFDSPFGDSVGRAIAEAAKALNPVERRLALAALRGMAQRKLKTP